MGSENAAQMTESISQYFVDQRPDAPVARMMSEGRCSCLSSNTHTDYQDHAEIRKRGKI